MENARPSTRVVKVGGSLFDFDRAAIELRHWLCSQTPAKTVMVAGGGDPVESVRRLQKEAGVGECEAHWMAIEMLDVNSQILVDWFPEFRLVDDIVDIIGCSPDEAQFVFAPLKWLRRNSNLPVSWDVTSDSIAAEVAQAIQKHSSLVELVLLKSRLPESAVSSNGASGLADIVDAHFGEALNGLVTVKIVNLRSFDFETVLLN